MHRPTKGRGARVPAFLSATVLLGCAVSGCGLGFVGITGPDEAGAADGPASDEHPRFDSGMIVPGSDGGPPKDSSVGHEGGSLDSGSPLDTGSVIETGPADDAELDTGISFDAPDDVSDEFDSSFGFDSGLCEGYAAPDVVANCAACGGEECQANGCFGGYWCNTATDKCHENPPSGCMGWE